MEYYKYDSEFPHMHPCNQNDESDAKFVLAKQADSLDSIFWESIMILRENGLDKVADALSNKRATI